VINVYTSNVDIVITDVMIGVEPQTLLTIIVKWLLIVIS